MLSNRPSELPPSAYSRVLIITRQGNENFDSRSLTKSFLKEVAQNYQSRLGSLLSDTGARQTQAEFARLLSIQLGGLQVLESPDAKSSSRSWRTLKSAILEDSKELQLHRKQAQASFPVLHFKAFFHSACDHFCSDSVAPFSFIPSSRISSPVSNDFPLHLSAFLKIVDTTQLRHFAVPVIASALAFESYPKGMHGKIMSSLLVFSAN
jgi:hypothetical protein